MVASGGSCKFCGEQDGLMVISETHQVLAHFTCILQNDHPYQLDSDRVLFDTYLNKFSDV